MNPPLINIWLNTVSVIMREVRMKELATYEELYNKMQSNSRRINILLRLNKRDEAEKLLKENDEIMGKLGRMDRGERYVFKWYNHI